MHHGGCENKHDHIVSLHHTGPSHKDNNGVQHVCDQRNNSLNQQNGWNEADVKCLSVMLFTPSTVTEKPLQLLTPTGLEEKTLVTWGSTQM